MTQGPQSGGARVTVLGTGSWGTTFATVLRDAGSQVSMWGRREEVCEQIRRGVNESYLPGVDLGSGLRATSDVDAALDGAEVVVLALPAPSVRDHLGAWRERLSAGPVLVSLVKGIELRTTMRVSEVMQDVLAVPRHRIAVVSGPNLAKEIAARQPTASVVACTDHDTAERVAGACSTAYFRPYTHTDVIGVELGGAVKNVIALAVGMAEGLGMGDNTKASIITRGLAETFRLGQAMGADPATLSGLAGMGDLVATCASPLSRNRTVGVELGRGRTVPEVVAAMRQTAEGITSCRSVLDLALAHDVDMPITRHVVGVVHQGLDVAEMGRRLMSRARRPERE